MIKFFKKIRQNLLREKKFKHYILYAIGEIILVVIGILIALSLNKSSELKKMKVTEIEILKGIEQDLIIDTIDINHNLKGYNEYIEIDSILLYHLYNKIDFNDQILDHLYNAINADWSLYLHRSTYDELKSKGLSLISNQELKKKINRLYQFDYLFIENAENSHHYYDHKKLLVEEGLNKYLRTDSNGLVMDSDTYRLLVSDAQAHYLIERSKVIKEKLLRIYIGTIESNESLRTLIRKEIEHLQK